MKDYRIQSLIQSMTDNQLDNLLISDPASIYYYTGYRNQPGERLYLLNISSAGQVQLYLNRLFPQPQDLQSEIEVIWYSDGEPILAKLVEQLTGLKIGIDKYWPSHFLLELLALNPELHPLNGSVLVDQQRAIKSLDEQELMAKASELNDQAMEAIIHQVQYGFSELTMVNKLREIYQDLNMDGFSFEPIIAYGGNGADPHHETNQDQPEIGDAVVIDIGAFYQGYASDMTRTVFYGQPSQEHLEIYDIVRRANEAAIAQIRPGVSFADIDLTARNLIEQAGYGAYFTHRLGHFIGQETHEAGDVSQYNHDLIKAGQIFSVEPGIYLPDDIGVRIEDLILVTEDGCQVLNHVTKEPIIIQPKAE
ncbi:M24 family metallopeptidase [Ignavigranum ruoffiae]|uniref:Xaa-Pro dipeptidase n=1 Tax=Ignavigranum ruoffiae TaxID=89093 RepID=A0A1H9GEP9_9LACT|nr:Xaa-Pro peptidase family protein [Ignavigranum ruoffiae]SEQ48590.1 Xaa-Pro dipeptidase [Ignavigranum ruoffiae]